MDKNPLYEKINQLRREYYKKKFSDQDPSNMYLHIDGQIENIFDNSINKKFEYGSQVIGTERALIKIENYPQIFKAAFKKNYGSVFTFIDEEEEEILRHMDLRFNFGLVNGSISFEEELKEIFKDWEMSKNEFVNKYEEYRYYELKLVLAFVLDDDDMLEFYQNKIEQINIENIEYSKTLFKNLQGALNENLEFNNVQILCSPSKPTFLPEQEKIQKILEVRDFNLPYDLNISYSLDLENIEEFKRTINKDSHIFTISHGLNGESYIYFNGLDIQKNILDANSYFDHFKSNEYLTTFFCSSENMVAFKHEFNHLTFSPSMGEEQVEIYLKCYLKGLARGKSHEDSLMIGQLGLKYRNKAFGLVEYYKEGELV